MKELLKHAYLVNGRLKLNNKNQILEESYCTLVANYEAEEKT